MFLLEMLAIGSFGFYAFIVLLFLLLVIGEVSDNRTFPTLGLIATFFIAQYIWHANLFHFIGSHWIFITLGVILYLVFGVLWGTFKWKGLVNKLVSQRDWVDIIANKNRPHIFIPQASQYKNKILGWMTYWPVSFLYYILHDPITEFFKWAFNKISGRLQAISDNAVKKAVEQAQWNIKMDKRAKEKLI